MKSKNSPLFIILIACLLVFDHPSLRAQPPKGKPQMVDPQKKEKIEALKAAFITRRLNLSREEAQAFWPVYNEYQNSLDNLNSEKRVDAGNLTRGIHTFSDDELKIYVDKRIIYKQRELDILKKYHSQFKEVLPIKKVGALYKAEDEFKLQLIKEAQSRNRH